MEKLVREKLKKILAQRAEQKETINEFNRLMGKHLSVIVCAGEKAGASNFDLREYNKELLGESPLFLRQPK